MKTIAILAGVLISIGAAASVQLPERPCAGRDCSPEMLEMIEKFHASVSVGDVGLPGVYSGECFHASQLYSSSKEHHGVVYLVKKESGEIYFNGSFAFFYEKNPYSDWTLEDAAQRYPEPFRKAFVKESGSSVADYSTDETVWVHFVRQNLSGDRLYLISYFGVGHLMTCELRVNF